MRTPMGIRGSRAGGTQPGSIYLADAQLQTPWARDVGLYRRVLAGVSASEYEAAAEAVPPSYGLTQSNVSRRFITANARALR